MNASKTLFSLALLALLSACAPATVQTTRGPSIDAKAVTQNVRGFSVGAFSGDLGGAFRERLLPALEGRGFVVTFAEARASADISDYLLLGNVEARVETVNNTDFFGRVYTVSSVNVVNRLTSRVISRKDGQTVRTFTLEPAGWWLTGNGLEEVARGIAEAVNRDFKPVRTDGKTARPDLLPAGAR